MATPYERQQELADAAGFDSVREYAEARRDFLDTFDTGLRGDILAEAVGTWAGTTEHGDNIDMALFIADMLEFDPDFDVDAYLDEVYSHQDGG